MKKKLKKKLIEATPIEAKLIVEEKSVAEEKPKEENESPVFLTFEEMTDKQMEHYLFEFSDSVYYQAVLYFIMDIDKKLLDSLASNDPFTQPTLMARNQGERKGIYNLKSKIEELVKINSEMVKSKEEKNKDENNTPSYNRW